MTNWSTIKHVKLLLDNPKLVLLKGNYSQMALPPLRVFRKHIEPHSPWVFQTLNQNFFLENRREAKATVMQIIGVTLTGWKKCLRPKAKRHYGQGHTEGKETADAKNQKKYSYSEGIEVEEYDNDPNQCLSEWEAR